MNPGQLQYETPRSGRGKRFWLAGLVALMLIPIAFGAVLVGLVGLLVGLPMFLILTRVKAINTPPRWETPHLCQWCGYDMRGIESQIFCPECGRVRDSS